MSRPLRLGALALVGALTLACGGVAGEVGRAITGEEPFPWEGEGAVRLGLSCEGACGSDAAVLVARLEHLGVVHEVHRASADSLDVTLEGVGDVTPLVRHLVKPGRLGFHPEVSPGSGLRTQAGCLPDSEPCEPVSWAAEAALDNRHIAGARAEVDPYGQPSIMVEWTPEGRARFRQLTEELVGQRLVAQLDGEVLMMPVVHEVIDGPEAMISLGMVPDHSEVHTMVAAMTQPPLAGSWSLASMDTP